MFAPRIQGRTGGGLCRPAHPVEHHFSSQPRRRRSFSSATSRSTFPTAEVACPSIEYACRRLGPVGDDALAQIANAQSLTKS